LADRKAEAEAMPELKTVYTEAMGKDAVMVCHLRP
jgi:hypothetical protein